jgi:hypothetical protein
MCYTYETYSLCVNCSEYVPGGRGYYNVVEHSPPCKPNCGGIYDIREPPDWAGTIKGGEGQVQREVGMEECLWCYEVVKEEEQNAKAKT